MTVEARVPKPVVLRGAHDMKTISEELIEHVSRHAFMRHIHSLDLTFGTTTTWDTVPLVVQNTWRGDIRAMLATALEWKQPCSNPECVAGFIVLTGASTQDCPTCQGKGTLGSFLIARTVKEPAPAFCCFLPCNRDADYHIWTCRDGDHVAGPDPYSDYTDACSAHVGELLGHQSNMVDSEEVEWRITPIISVATDD